MEFAAPRRRAPAKIQHRAADSTVTSDLLLFLGSGLGAMRASSLPSPADCPPFPEILRCWIHKCRLTIMASVVHAAEGGLQNGNQSCLSSACLLAARDFLDVIVQHLSNSERKLGCRHVKDSLSYNRFMGWRISRFLERPSLDRRASSGSLQVAVMKMLTCLES